MDREKMAMSPSGRVISSGEGISRYYAFLPNPLPPKFQMSMGLTRALSQADYALGQLAMLGRVLPNASLLIRPFMRKEAVLSSRIEGTQADLKDVMLLEAEQLSLLGPEIRKRNTDAQEVLNYVQALEWALAELDTFPLSLRLIRGAHERLVCGVRGAYASPGEFRNTQNWIGPASCTLNEATYVPPPPYEMNEALAQVEHYMREGNAYPPLIRLGLIHYQFEAVHPFIDGNGRIGRLLMTLLLCYWDLLPQPLLYLSAYFERHRDEYYARLLAVSERGEWEEWLTFFLKAVAEQATDATRRAQQILDLKRTLKEQVAHATQSALILRLVDELFSTPVVTIQQSSRVLDANYQAVRRAIYILVEMGVLQEAAWPKRPKVFFAEQILSLLD